MIIFRIIEIVISRTGSIIKNRRNKMIIVFQTKTINKTGSTTIKDRHQIGIGINSNNRTGILIQTGITTRDRMSIATGITIVVHGSLLAKLHREVVRADGHIEGHAADSRRGAFVVLIFRYVSSKPAP